MRIDILGQEAKSVTISQYFLKELARLWESIQCRQGINVPKDADDEGRLWPTEIIFADIAEQKIPRLQATGYSIDGSRESRDVSFEKIQLVKQEQSRIQFLAVESRNEAVHLRIPGPFAD